MSGTRYAGSWLWRTRTSKWPRKLKHEKVTACEPFPPHLAFALAWPREMTKSLPVRALVMRQVVLIATLLVGSLVSAGALELQESASSVGGIRIVAPARDDGRYAKSPLKSWFDRLASGKGLCCSFADGFSVDNVDWDTQDGHYRVRLYGEWIVVPDNAVVTEPNKFGPAVVWPYMDTDGQTQIRCFLPGAGA